MAFEDYDVGLAFARIEDELIASMMRNLKRHLREEEKEGFDWSQWQVEQLKYLQEYRQRNRKKFGPQFADINRKMKEAIQEAYENGQKEEELRILETIVGNKKMQRRYANQHASIEAAGDAFFRPNEKKLEALMDATQNDMQKAEQAVLRRSNDQYRKIIFDAQMYANTGAATIEKAVDMATKDFLSRGIDSIVYKNGSRHTISDYADMYIRTAERRATLMGEGRKRQEWGESLVIVNKRGGHPCPKCLEWVGKILIDDVYSGGKPDGKHKLLSEAMAEGLYHPRCKDGHTTYIPGVSSIPDPVTAKEKKEAAKAEVQEQREQLTVRQEEKFTRLAEHSLDPENQKRYEARKKEWRERQIGRSEESEKTLITMINQEGTDSLLDAYDRRRESFNLNLVPADDLRKLSFNPVNADYTGLSVETARAFNTTISNLSEEYLSGITAVKVADPKEMFGASFFAETQHNERIGQKVLVINPLKSKNANKMIERIRILSDKGHCVYIPEGMEAQYVATHEFAHGLLQVGKDVRKDYIGQDLISVNRTRKQIRDLYEEYLDEIRSIEAEISELRKHPALTDFSASVEEQLAALERYGEAVDRLNAVKISDYSMENADEFMAEAFTQNRIGVSRSKYSDRVMEVLDREYRLDAQKEKPLARIRKKLLRNGRAGENSMVRLFFNDSNYYTVPQAEWFPDAKPGSHEVKNIDRVFFNGEYHDIDNVKIQFKTKPKERKVAELLSKKVGGPIYLRPIINQPEGIHSADIEFNGIEYDIKTLEPGPGKNKIYNRVKKKPGQSTRYIVDITNTDLSDEEVNSQISKVFWSQETLFVKELVIIRGDNILRIAKRL